MGLCCSFLKKLFDCITVFFKTIQWRTQDSISEGGNLNFHNVLYLVEHVELCYKQKSFLTWQYDCSQKGRMGERLILLRIIQNFEGFENSEKNGHQSENSNLKNMPLFLINGRRKKIISSFVRRVKSQTSLKNRGKKSEFCQRAADKIRILSKNLE